ncbi:MAG: DUF5018 domain-containing protein, partial [Flavobacteriaceae bacterium]|nr:DUF5018 domain-containing protein [Flavobacteriaceae bacterium]
KIKISYTQPTIVKVTAEDGTTTKDYSISFQRTKSPENSLLYLKLDIAGKDYVANPISENIKFTVPYGTDISNVMPTLSISNRATANITSGVAINDFVLDQPKEIKVTAENSGVQRYFVTISQVPPRKVAKISGISIDFTQSQSLLGGSQGELNNVFPTMNHSSGYILYTFPYTTDDAIENIDVPYTLNIKDGGTSSKAEKITISYAMPTFVKVTAEDGVTTKDYFIVFKRRQSPENKFTEFELNIAGQDYVANPISENIEFTVPFGTNISSVMPTFSVSDRAMASITSGTAITNFVFAQPKEVTVTAENGSRRKYSITINQVPPKRTTKIDNISIDFT